MVFIRPLGESVFLTETVKTEKGRTRQVFEPRVCVNCEGKRRPI